jgi:ribosomal protein L21E
MSGSFKVGDTVKIVMYGSHTSPNPCAPFVGEAGLITGMFSGYIWVRVPNRNHNIPCTGNEIAHWRPTPAPRKKMNKKEKIESLVKRINKISKELAALKDL